jgi:predicted esterase
MDRRSIPVRIHGRFLVAPASEPAGFLVGFHGYAQNAEAMMEDLRRLPDSARWTLVAIQGLHRFYNRENQVVASWMTREDRELAIADNVAFVDAVLDAVAHEHGTPAAIVCVGFSQGVAMAYRTAARSARRIDAVIALAGDVPPELNVPATRLPPVLIGRGTRDRWYTEEKMQADLRVLAGMGVAARAHVFDGGHEWSAPFETEAAQFVAALPGHLT